MVTWITDTPTGNMFFGKNKSTKSLVCKWFRNVNPRTIHLCVPSSPSRSRLFRRVYFQRDPVWVPSGPSRSRCNIFGIPACGCTAQSKYPGCLITCLGKYLIEILDPQKLPIHRFVQLWLDKSKWTLIMCFECDIHLHWASSYLCFESRVIIVHLLVCEWTKVI